MSYFESIQMPVLCGGDPTKNADDIKENKDDINRNTMEIETLKKSMSQGTQFMSSIFNKDNSSKIFMLVIFLVIVFYILNENDWKVKKIFNSWLQTIIWIFALVRIIMLGSEIYNPVPCNSSSA